MKKLVAVAVAALSLFAGCAPSVPTDALSDVEAISGGEDLTCARARDRSTWCWGDAVLVDQTTQRKYAAEVEPPNVVVAAKRSGQTCVLFANQTLACTDASFGRADATWPVAWTERNPSPWKPRLLRQAPIAEVASFGVGTYIDCARGVDGDVWCWGDYAEVLRTGTHDTSRRFVTPVPGASVPALVRGIPTIVDLSVGESNALAIGRDGSAWTLGGLARGAERVPNIDDAVQAASGSSFHCIRRAAGSVACWREGFAIDALAALPTTPTFVENLTGAKTLAAGYFGACAIDETDHVSCWGNHPPAAKERKEGWQRAEKVEGVEGARALVVGSNHACALVTRGHVFCWGHEPSLGIGIEQDFETKPKSASGYVPTGAADDPAASLKRRTAAVAMSVVASIALLVFVAWRVGLRAVNAWRLLPSAATVVGAGYRASQVVLPRQGLPGSVRAALVAGLASVGADVAYVAMFGFYAVAAIGLGLRQYSRNNAFSGVMNLLTGALVLVVVGWLALVATTVIRAACARTTALGRLRTIGVLGIVGHALLGVFAFGGRREVALLIDRKIAWGSSLRDDASLPLVGLMLFASLVGIVASALMVAASRVRKELV